jgi:hypothetical protein
MRLGAWERSLDFAFKTPEWKKHAADLESEMLKRGMVFEMIDWSENQPKLPSTGGPAPP